MRRPLRNVHHVGRQTSKARCFHIGKGLGSSWNSPTCPNWQRPHSSLNSPTCPNVHIHAHTLSTTLEARFSHDSPSSSLPIELGVHVVGHTDQKKCSLNKRISVGHASDSCDLIRTQYSCVPLDWHHLTTAQLGLMVDQVRDRGFSTKFHQVVTEKHVVVAHVFLPDGLLLAFTPLNYCNLDLMTGRGLLSTCKHPGQHMIPNTV